MAWRRNRNKYNNHKITVDGEVFDSEREYRRYLELQLLEKSGVIRDLHRQVTFDLVPEAREPDRYGPRGGLHRGKVIERGVSYIADFTYYVTRPSGEEEFVVEDCKGMRTDDYKIKRKLMLFIHKIRVRET